VISSLDACYGTSSSSAEEGDEHHGHSHAHGHGHSHGDDGANAPAVAEVTDHEPPLPTKKKPTSANGASANNKSGAAASTTTTAATTGAATDEAAPVDVTAQSDAAVVHVVKDAKKGLSLAKATTVNTSAATSSSATAAPSTPSDNATTTTASSAKKATTPAPVNQLIDLDGNQDFFSDMIPQVTDNRRLDLSELEADSHSAAPASKRLVMEDELATSNPSAWGETELE